MEIVINKTDQNDISGTYLQWPIYSRQLQGPSGTLSYRTHSPAKYDTNTKTNSPTSNKSLSKNTCWYTNATLSFQIQIPLRWPSAQDRSCTSSRSGAGRCCHPLPLTMNNEHLCFIKWFENINGIIRHGNLEQLLCVIFCPAILK